MPRTRLRCRDALAAALALAWALSALAAPALICTLALPAQVPAGGPAPLRLSLLNRGASTVQFLAWGTPFEPAWFASYVAVFRDGTELPYGGARMKRGDPDAAHYERIAPGATRSASIDLAPVFDLTLPGRYRLRPRIVLHDVAAGAAAVPRPRSRLVPQTLRCPELRFEVLP